MFLVRARNNVIDVCNAVERLQSVH